MGNVDLVWGGVAILIGIGAATGMFVLWLHWSRSERQIARALMKEAQGSTSFLFDDEVLVDATPRARSLFADSDAHRSDWENFLTLLSARFPHLRSQCRDLASVGTKTISAHDGESGWIEAEYWNGLARLTLVQDRDCPTDMIDPLTARAMEHELETLRSLGENSPQLIWKRDAEGVLVWANNAYLEMSQILHPVTKDSFRPWPPKDVFADAAVPHGAAPLVQLHRIEFSGQPKPLWFEVTSLKRGTDTMYFGIDATAEVTSREEQKVFVQTLSKTFAQLSVGLAIFDAERRLVLFNPALTDLTGLPVDFLIARPVLLSFLDRLRDSQMMPEPKVYSDWRDQMAALEAAAIDGTYLEIWALPNGQTFRVAGKPHPNGAVAFLFEDISDEISLTRKYRSQIDVGHAVLDNLDEAIAVFSSSGSLILANSAYKSFWLGDADSTLSDAVFTDELKLWQRRAAPSPVWVKLHNAIEQGSGDSHWRDAFIIEDVGAVVCSYAPLPDGNHQVTFLKKPPEDQSTSDIEVKQSEPERFAVR